MEKNQKNDVLEILFEQIPLAKLIEVLQTGKFHPSPDDPVNEKEEVLGEFTDTEKAFWSAIHFLETKAKEIADSNNQMVEEALKNGREIDKIKVVLNKSEHEVVSSSLQLVHNVFWHSLHKRFTSEKTIEAGGIAIRSGYRVVSYCPNDSDIFAGVLGLLKQI